MIALYTKAIATALILFWVCAILVAIQLHERPDNIYLLHLMLATFLLSIIAIWVTV